MHTRSQNPSDYRGKLRIALAFPEWEPFQDAFSGRAADAAYVLLANLSRGLAQRGHSLTFCAPRSPYEYVITSDPCRSESAPRTWTAGAAFDLTGKATWKAQKLLGIPYLNVFSNYRYMDAAMGALKGVDLIYERNGLYNAGLAMAAMRLGLPYVMFFDADQIMELDIMGRPLTSLLRQRAREILLANLEAADRIICVSEAGRQRLVDQWQVAAEKVVVFPNAVDVERFRPDPLGRERVRSELGLTDEPLIIFVGNFFHWHDVDTLLAAFAFLAGSRPDARLVLVGDGERRAEMMRRTSSLGLDHAVRFMGIVPHADVPGYIAAADIAVAPYPALQQELWLSPLKLFEYMSCGKAVVASAAGQIPEVIRDDWNGLLVPPGEAAALACAMNRLIEDSKTRSLLGRQAREDALNKYSWDRYLTRLEEVFHAVIIQRSEAAR